MQSTMKAAVVREFGKPLVIHSAAADPQRRELIGELLREIIAANGGILLLHDTKLQTAAMVPEFLRALKRRGYSVVHVTPPARPSTAAAN